MNAESVLVSRLSEVETVSAVWRQHREGAISVGEAHVLSQAVRSDFHNDSQHAPYSVVAMSTRVIDRAQQLIAVHGLRTGDAIQLASALVARESLPDCEAFAAFDVRLRNAAQAVGFVLIPREEQLA